MIRPIGSQLGVCKAIGFASLVALSGCVTQQDEAADTNTAATEPKTSQRVSGLEHFEFGDRSSSAWVSDGFEGSKSRQFIGDTLRFEVDQKADEGGFDVGVSQLDITPAPVAMAKSDKYVCSSYSVDLAGPGRWWAGPKISVNWQGEESAKQNGDDWYENYIVEIASSSPQELHDLFTGDYFKAEELTPLELAGSSYRNYKIRFHDWWQFWSVRQDYRETGMLPIEPIVDTWIANGLPTDKQFDGVKANLETYGPIKGAGALKISASSDPSQLICKNAAAN